MEFTVESLEQPALTKAQLADTQIEQTVQAVLAQLQERVAARLR